MTTWNDTLAALGARHDATLTDQVADFGRVLSVTELKGGFVSPITGQGIIAARGEEAAKFLHSQLTNDVEHLGQTEARLAGYCTPKGRLQASFLMWRDAEAVYLQLPRELQGFLQKRLSMFVLRAKAKLSDASTEPAFAAMLGFGGARAQQVLETVFGTLPALPYTRIEHRLGVLIRLADAFDTPRYQWLTSVQNAQEYLPAFMETLVLGGGDAWQLSDIHAGVPQITLRTQERFVPQMINFELLGGVNFKKGCYPGQEIVARSQYLGKLKRRTALATIASAMAKAGDEVFDLADPDQPCGMIVNSAPNGVDGCDALVEMKLASLADSQVRLGSAGGAALVFQPMPYPLDALDL